MPTYEYKCFSCEHRLEVIQKITEEPLTTCPSCGEEKLKRLLSSTSFQLKGSGWYATDYGSKSTGSSSSVSSNGNGSTSSSTSSGETTTKDSGTKDSSPKKVATTSSSSKKDAS